MEEREVISYSSKIQGNSESFLEQFFLRKILISIVFLILGMSAAWAVPFAPKVTLESELQELGFSIPNKALASIDFSLKDLSGDTKQLSDYRGKVVFLNFWATWCGPCRTEMPSMERLYNTLKSKGFEIVAVNQGEREKTVSRFITDYDLTFDVLLDGSQEIGSMYGARSIPTTYLIDRNGMILGMAVGGREWDTPEYLALFNKILQL